MVVTFAVLAVCTSLCPHIPHGSSLRVYGIQGGGSWTSERLVTCPRWPSLEMTGLCFEPRVATLIEKLGSKQPHSSQTKNRKHPSQTNSIPLLCLLHTCCVCMVHPGQPSDFVES